MFRLVNAVSLSALVSGFSLLLAACGGGGGSGSPNPAPPVNPNPPAAAISAQASIPSSVASGATFAVSVALTASSGSGTASVQLVDTGTATPQINCGPAQTLTVGGGSATFDCQAPTANPSGSNTHEMQVNVNGTANLAAPVSVAITPGVNVGVQLTDSSGTVITTATPGEAFNVAFSSPAGSSAAGTYTVTAPGGWTVGGSGACSVSTQTVSCTVPVTVAGSATAASYTLTFSGSSGSSPLTVTSLALQVEPAASMTFSSAQNISDTLYANEPGQTTTFTYQPVFLFQNTSGGPVTITGLDTGTALTSTSIEYGCNVTPSAQASYTLVSLSQTPLSSNNCVLQANQYFAVSGSLPNSYAVPASPTAPAGAAAISISLLNGTQTLNAPYTDNVTFVTYVPNHVAVRVVNAPAATTAPTATTVSVAAVYGPNMVTFATASGVANVGTTAASSGANFEADQVALPKAGGVFYMPYGTSGDIYLTRGKGGFNSAAVPSPTNLPAPPSFLYVEMTYQPNLPAPAAPCPSYPSCENLTVDQTYVNFISMLGSFNAMGNSLPFGFDTASATHGVTSDLTQQQIYQAIESQYLVPAGGPWATTDPAASTAPGYVRLDANGNVATILAPIQADGTTVDPMPGAYYDTYVSSLWTYLTANPIYVDASGITGATNCILKGQVTNSSGVDSGDLVFTAYSGTCPTAQSIDGSYTNNCGAAGNQACTDAPFATTSPSPSPAPTAANVGLAFAEFNKCDFILAAGNNDCHPTASPVPVTATNFFANLGLWGPNGTYRAIIGRAIAGYQAAGLLPCSATDPAKPMNSANAQAYLASGDGFMNPACLTGLTSAPTYNVYAYALNHFADVYNYSYGDFLGKDGTITYSATALGTTTAPNLLTELPVAQPVTIILR